MQALRPGCAGRGNPERLVHQTGRLERSLGTGRPAVVDLSTARRWIARARQPSN